MEGCSNYKEVFRTRCEISGKQFNLTISNGYTENVVSKNIVDELGLPLIELPYPHKVRMEAPLGQNIRIWVDKQVEICFSVKHSQGVYEDRRLFDIADSLPVRDIQIVLGRPWLFDRNVVHEAHLDRFSFQMDGNTVALVPGYVEKAANTESDTNTENGKRLLRA